MSEPESKKKILIIEDEPPQLQAMSDAIKFAGYDVLEAHDGVSGLSIALAKTPNLIVLDNKMPQMSGYMMLRKLRAENSWGQRVPVIFFSNVRVEDDEQAEDIQQAGAAMYLMKSDTSLQELVQKISGLIGI